MKTKTITQALAILLCFASLTALGQRTQSHTVNFSNIDGFSGYVTFTTKYIGFATQLSADNGTLVLKKYDADEESLAALKKAGYDLYGYPESGVTPNENYGYEVTGNAYVSTYAALIEASVSKLHINRDLGEKMVTPDFPKDVVDEVKKGNLWEKSGGFRNEEVVTLYISEFKNEIQRIIYAAKKEKEAAEQKEKEQKEAEEKAKKEQAEKEKQTTEAKEKAAASGSTASSGSSSKKDDKNEEKDSDDKSDSKHRKSDHTVYHPKSNRQLYDELKALTDANPALLNDPKIRTRLSGYKVMADRDDRNMRDYQSFKMITGGGYHPQTSAALNSIYQTNGNIASAEMAVDAGVDVATNVVNSIIEERNRKEQQRLEANQRRIASHQEKVKAINNWEYQLLEQRREYEAEVKRQVSDNFTLIETIEDLPITYESEKYVDKGYWDGHFEKITKTMKDWDDDVTYKMYLVEMNGLYGILGDGGEALYPPQFEGIYAFNDAGKRPRFLVNIKDKWGEILADGSIAEDIKYDGIWYSADKESKILEQDNNWQEKSVLDNHLLRQFSNSQIANLYSGGLIPVINTNLKALNISGSYSLNSDGQIYGFGETGNSDINSMEYESVRRGQTIERLYKIKGKWFVTVNYGTKNMTTIEMPKKFVVEALRETESGKKWGAINQNGEIVVPFEHNFIRRTANGFTTDKGNYNIK